MTVSVDTEKLKGLIVDLELGSESTLSTVVDAAIKIKYLHDEVGKTLSNIKGFFAASGNIGDSFEGTMGNIKLMGRASTSVDPQTLLTKLLSLKREEEFVSLVSVKIKDTRDKLGTTIFNTIADIVPEASITVKIKKS